ncbi:MAG TPA: [Fe-Fe] hydrogenase large subunit C-terminal domain-containing protein [Clostridia bacterium]|nr:[Fe-Fe] hydrogenase large subunit C-terminal domain-containing protein [Clostridia bacterium]
MGTIQFREANCKNCYKCIRSCPVKAIAFKNEQAEIVEEECMLCGNCLKVCPQNAKTVKSDIETVKSFIRKKEKVYVSLAPSFISVFNKNNGKWMFSALKKLGFTYAEETAVGATEVSKQYEKLMEAGEMKNIITTACPSIIFLVEKHYPELIGMLAPVVSPMIAHAKMLRQTYGQRIKVVFIGPCLSKKDECNDFQNSGAVDAVLTFEELESWIKSEGISEQEDFDCEIKACGDMISRVYPTPGGILKTIGSMKRKNYKCISIDGVDRCMKVLDSIRDDGIEKYFIEMNSCQGGCIGGPCMGDIKGGFLEARERLIEYFKSCPGSNSPLMDVSSKVDLSKKFIDRSRKHTVPSEPTIRAILESIGKFTKDKELNCGACGYQTCREKAIAVYNGKAQLHMCLPYMRERAESISNLIINTTPNAIFALDSELGIQEANTAARGMFGLGSEDVAGRSIYDFLPCEDFQNVLDERRSIYDSKYYYDRYDITAEQSIIFIPEQNIVVAIIKDISREEQRRRQVFEIRSKNAELAQKVIEKQMRVAQEIASLLGETTAETKVALTKLKKSIMSEMGDN